MVNVEGPLGIKRVLFVSLNGINIRQSYKLINNIEGK